MTKRLSYLYEKCDATSVGVRKSRPVVTTATGREKREIAIAPWFGRDLVARGISAARLGSVSWAARIQGQSGT